LSEIWVISERFYLRRKMRSSFSGDGIKEFVPSVGNQRITADHEAESFQPRKTLTANL